jgi:3-methylfumaryl-CoA hydratase
MSEHEHASADPVDIDKLQQWVGRTQTLNDRVSTGPLAGLAGLLDHAMPPWREGEMPPLGHWLYFLRHERQSSLDVDGHPKRGNFLPPVPLPRRMWAAGRLKFLEPIPLGSDITRRSTIAAVTAKHGRSGPMVFVTVRHEVLLGDSIAIVEDQDIVYRSLPTSAVGALPAAPAISRQPDNIRTITSGPVQLFRFSALTFNAHRIHYDRDYARDMEGYPGLVVHGPWIAMLLMDHFLRQGTARKILSFNFRAERPIFDTTSFDLCSRMTPAGADLWAVDSQGATAFSAIVETES